MHLVFYLKSWTARNNSDRTVFFHESSRARDGEERSKPSGRPILLCSAPVARVDRGVRPKRSSGYDRPPTRSARPVVRIAGVAALARDGRTTEVRRAT